MGIPLPNITFIIFIVYLNEKQRNKQHYQQLPFHLNLYFQVLLNL